MKIKYKFVDGTVAEVEVDESIGAVIAESRCQDGNLARKESYHCYSLEAMQFEGAEHSDGGNLGNAACCHGRGQACICGFP